MTKLADIDVAVLSEGAGTANREHPLVVVAVAGEVDIATSPKLARHLQALMDTGEVQIVVDMEAVEFIDVSGVRVLVDAADKTKTRGGELVIRRPSFRVQRVFDILELDGQLPVESRSDEVSEQRSG